MARMARVEVRFSALLYASLDSPNNRSEFTTFAVLRGDPD